MKLSFSVFVALALGTTDADIMAPLAPSFSAVYGMNNQANNEILVYSRDVATGLLTFEEAVSTGGSGAHIGPVFPNQIGALASQDSIAVGGPGGRCLINVNAGSETISTFSILGSRNIKLAGVFPTNGIFPASVATLGNLVYVLNAGGQGSIQGFAFTDGCRLRPIGETIPLDQGPTAPTNPPDDPASPSEIGFTPSGDILVTIKVDGGGQNFNSTGLGPNGEGLGSLNHYKLSEDGTTSAEALTKTIVANRVSTSNPFGFDFDPEGRLLMGEVNIDGTLINSGVSVWEENHGSYEEVAVLNSMQTCGSRLKYNPRNQCAYTTNPCNFPSGNSLSAFRAPNGDWEVELPIPVVSTLPTLRPLDLVVSRGGEHVYVYSSGFNDDFAEGQPRILMYGAAADGCGLTEMQTVSDGYKSGDPAQGVPAGIAIFPAPLPTPSTMDEGMPPPNDLAPPLL